ncbi:adenylosuccinate lyase [Sulfobacillus thermosulfidooxidans]|uniref:adenylosuccinate lyase n=1 Tax=Sulfobacillus thermosulfidooxidans TaxID=28034 RepID=UPI0006B600FD|nr:adenylosuccinate lyase [Sulfobacillus thermosulfidooxidans]
MSLKAISPLDGRYGENTRPLTEVFSEWALIKFRLEIEIRWFIFMSESPWMPEVRPLTREERGFLEDLLASFGDESARRIKEIENHMQHDVKAVEYYLKERIRATTLAPLEEFVHFGCTSEDINNLAYALMLRQGIAIWQKEAAHLVGRVARDAQQASGVAMLSHTHGQPASPTTVGKELAVFVYRWNRQLLAIEKFQYMGKFNGAVGNFNAHWVAYPHVPWPEVARTFVESLGLKYNPLTTQIEPHDYMAELFHTLVRFNTIATNFCRDIWLYISKGYFQQSADPDHVGSSTMPHKVNPIHFENAEANFLFSNAVLNFLATKLPISRMQRDLSDSSALRNIGVAIGHSYIALQFCGKGLGDLSINEGRLAEDLEANWNILAEAIQTVMRKEGVARPYELLKTLTRGIAVTADDLKGVICEAPISAEERDRLLVLAPHDYTGLADELAKALGPIDGD